MPDSSVDVFNERITDIMNVIPKENKMIYEMGDLNIDYLKSDVPSNIMKFIDEMKEIDWQCVFVEKDAQSAYSKFHEIVSCK